MAVLFIIVVIYAVLLSGIEAYQLKKRKEDENKL